MLSRLGNLYPLIIPSHTGIMNPSIINDNGNLIVNIRQVNYAFYHSEKNLFHHPFGPLTYIHPENDIKLRTWNYMCQLGKDYEITEYVKTDTSKFDTYAPKWEFVGLEDARLVRWNGDLYQTGVRRDTTTNGKGRMELSKLNEAWEEVQRDRIPTPIEDTYCEKNWMPVLDQPFTYVKWANPTEVVKYNPKTKKTSQIVHNYSKIPHQTRGGSQVIPWDDQYIAVTHDVDLFKSNTGRKNAMYTHRILVWDKNWNLQKMTKRFNFMDGNVEFAAGMCIYKGKFLITFGFQDNAAYLLEIEEDIMRKFIDDNPDH